MKQSLFLSICTLLLLCSIPSLAQVKNRIDKSPLPIIDIHLHAFTVAKGLKMDYTDNYAPQSQQEYENQVFVLLKKYNIYAFSSGEDPVLQSWKAKEPKRILTGKFIMSPSQLDIDELRQEIKDKKWDVLGEVVTQYAGLPANDPTLDPRYSLAEEMDIPVSLHDGFGPAGAAYIPLFKNFRISLIHPSYLEGILIKYPRLRPSVCHAGYPMIDEILAMLYAFPQLYVDISAIDWVLPKKEFYAYLQRLVDAGYGQRIMYGSDEMNWPQGIELSIKNIQDAPFLTEEQKRNIFYNNAVRFFKLNKEDVRGK